MKKRELSQLYYINRDIERRKQRIEQLDAEVTQITVHFSDMPKAKGHSDRLSRIVAEIVDEKKMIAYKLEEMTIERRRLEYYIDSIPDAKLRLYMSLRFVNGMSWIQVAYHSGNDATESGIRMAVERYIAK